MIDLKIINDKKAKLKEGEEEYKMKQLKEINLERKLDLRKSIQEKHESMMKQKMLEVLIVKNEKKDIRKKKS